MKILMMISLILARVLMVYSFLIWARILVSWFVRYPKPYGFIYYLGKIVDPYLGLFRSRKAQLGMLDFSPIIAIGLVEVAQTLFYSFGVFGHLTLGYILSLFINAFWSYGLSLFLILAGIMLLFKTIASFSSSMMFASMANSMSMAVSPITNFVRSFFPNRRRDGSYRVVKDSTVNVISLVLVVVLYFVLRYLCGYLSMLALRLPF